MTTPLRHASFWYRSDPDTAGTVRDYPQLVRFVSTLEDVQREAQALAAKGHRLQRIVVHTECPECQGRGVNYESIIPLETTQPPWRLTTRRCDACAGNGWTGAGTVVYPEAAEATRSQEAR